MKLWPFNKSTGDVVEIDVPTTLHASGDKPTSVRILAYAGGVMSPPGYPNRVIDLNAMEHADVVALLANHDNTVGSVAGQGNPIVQAGQLWVQGQLSTNEVGRNIAALSKSGVPLQASLTVEVLAQQFVKPGGKVKVNGRDLIAGPDGLYVVTKSRLREVSIVPVGADANTSVHVAASLGGSESMRTNQQPEQLLVATAPITFDGQHQSESASVTPAENDRIARISATFADMPDTFRRSEAGIELRAQAILGQIPESELAGRMLTTLRASRTSAPAIHSHSSSPSGRSTIAASLMIRAGFEALAVNSYGEQTVDEARRLGLSNSRDLMRACIRMDGHDIPADGSIDELLKASGASSMFSLPVALSDAAHKTLLPLYNERVQWWQLHCFIASCDNFKNQYTIRPTMGGALTEVGADGQLKSSGPLREIVVTWSVGTFGRVVSITRQDWRNDDVGFFSQIIPMLAKMAARSVSDKAAEVLLTNAGSFFSSGNNNLYEEGSALSVASLAAGIRAFRERRDRDNNDLSLIPSVLAVSPKNEMLAKALLESEFLARAADLDNSPTGNPLKSLLKVVPESRLSNTAKFANASDDHWFLFGAPSDVPMVAGFLDGKKSPTIETFGFSSSVEYLTMATRCFMDFGFALGDSAAAYKATGEESEET